METKKDNKIKYYFILHIILAMYSLFGIFSKFASGQEFMSFKFIMCYGVVLLNLFVYAICWQQIIWGIIFGFVFFNEQITWNKIVGAIIIVVGIILVVTEREEEVS